MTKNSKQNLSAYVDKLMRQPATETSRPKSTRAAGSKKPSRSKSVAWKKYTSAHKFQLAPHPPPAASNQPSGRIRVFSSSIQNWTLFSCHPTPFYGETSQQKECQSPTPPTEMTSPHPPPSEMYTTTPPRDLTYACMSRPTSLTVQEDAPLPRR